MSETADQETEEFEAAIEPATLKLIADVLSPIDDEIRLYIDEDEIHAAVSDRGNVIVADAGHHEIETNHSFTVGVSTDELLDKFENSFFVDYSRKVNLRTRDDGETLAFTQGIWSDGVEAINHEKLPASPDISDTIENVDYEVVGTAPAWKLVGALRSVADIADEVVYLRPHHDKIGVEGYDERGASDPKYQEWFGIDADTFPRDLDSSVVLLSPDYVVDFCDAVPTQGEVRFWFGDEQPLVAESSEGPSVALAPRLDRRDHP